MRFTQIIHPFSSAAKSIVLQKEFPGEGLKFEGIQKQALEMGRNRLMVTGALFALAFLIIGARVVELSFHDHRPDRAPYKKANANKNLQVRADITDRNGILIATSLPTAALYANPQHIIDPDEDILKLKKVIPSLDTKKLSKLLSTNQKFVWLHRKLTPKLQFAVNALGIPGLYFKQTERRVYPHGSLVSHLIGRTDVDGRGLSGVEGYFESQLSKRRQPLQLSLDVRIQALVRSALEEAIEKFSAIGATGIVLDANTGEVISMVSLPDFDPNIPISAAGGSRFNRATKGLYEMGSTFKLFTAAMALDSGRVRLGDRFDATKPIKISRFTISDYHAKNKWLTFREVIVHSSNIGAAKIALEVGTNLQKKYLKRLGLLSKSGVELIEVGTPLTPKRWREINTMTISYGHGIAVSPLQLTSGIGALVNGGILFDPTLIKVEKVSKRNGNRAITSKTSQTIRELMRLVVREGTGQKADVPGYFVGGKTGTADKPGIKRRGYRNRGKISSFVAAFPIQAPQYIILALLDEPKGIEATYGYATGGWVAAPVVSKIIRQMAPLLGIGPLKEFEEEIKPQNVHLVSQPSQSKQKPTKVSRPLSNFEKGLSELLRSPDKPRG